MPGWNSVLQEINKKQANGLQAVDLVRRRYMERLQRYTKRNVIAYYSAWLSRPPQTPNLEIGDDDKNGLMTAVHRLDRTRGVDLILHTPGGNIAATESLVDYLWQMFGSDIRVIVPQIAMSAGTMIACSAKSIVMGKQSSLGPIDPQFSGIAAQAVIDEFNMAIRNIEQNPSSTPLWQAIIGKYHPTFLLECIQAIDWSRQIVTGWLVRNMLEGHDNPPGEAAQILNVLADHAHSKTHARHLSIETCQSIGLHVEALEDDPKLQDLVLTIHHAFMHTFARSHAIKIIENHLGVATVLMEGIPPIGQPFMLGAMPNPLPPAPAEPAVHLAVAETASTTLPASPSTNPS